MTSKYGIDVPVDFFVGDGEKKGKVVYSVVPEIRGKDLANRDDLQEIGNPVQDLYAAVSKYYLDKLRNGDFYLVDISGASQYVFGRERSEIDEEEKIYMVDTDILLDNRRKSLPVVVYWMCRHLATMERRLNSKNIQARQNIKEFLGEYGEVEEAGSKNNDRLLEIKRFLQGKEFGNKIKPAIPLFEE